MYDDPTGHIWRDLATDDAGNYVFSNGKSYTNYEEVENAKEKVNELVKIARQKKDAMRSLYKNGGHDPDDIKYVLDKELNRIKGHGIFYSKDDANDFIYNHQGGWLSCGIYDENTTVIEALTQEIAYKDHGYTYYYVLIEYHYTDFFGHDMSDLHITTITNIYGEKVTSNSKKYEYKLAYSDAPKISQCIILWTPDGIGGAAEAMQLKTCLKRKLMI